MDTASESFPSSQNTPSDLEDKALSPPYPTPTGIDPLASRYNELDSYAGFDNAFVVIPGVLRLAHPPEYLNDNDSYRNLDIYDVDNVTNDTVSPYEDSSSIPSLKGSVDLDPKDNANNLKCEIPNDLYAPKSGNVPLRLGNPRLASTLTLTDDHPLMGSSSPESPPSAGNYPDLILPSRRQNNKDESIRNNSSTRTNEQGNLNLNSDYSGMLSLSSTEDESFNKSLINGDLYSDGFSLQDGPQRNTSKNNLYFSENFNTSDGNKSVEGSVSSDDPRTNNYTTYDGKLSVGKSANKMSVQPDILDSRKRNTNISAKSEIKYHIPIDSSTPEITGRKKVKPDIRAPKIKSNNLAKMNSEHLPHQVLGRIIIPDRSAARGDAKVSGLDYALCVGVSDLSVHDYVSQVMVFLYFTRDVFFFS